MGLRRGALAGVGVRVGRLPDPGFWAGRRVLLTGQTGFKGAWAALWLASMGAHVTGFALDPEADPTLHALAGAGQGIADRRGDLRVGAAVRAAVAAAEPEIVLHLAAQPLVRRAVAEPAEAFEVNLMGTVHLLDALREAGPRAILVVTSDKVYANDGAGRAFVEADRLGGKDAYSASKAAAEIAAGAYRQSYFAPRGIALATVRGGNVIGGGDFAADRLVPDLVRAVAAGTELVLRHPEATRPWQHVLDCLSGYLVYAEALALGEPVPPSLNIGPDPGRRLSVGEVADAMLAALGGERGTGWRHEPVPGSLEVPALAVDAGEARRALAWRDRLPGMAALDWTAAWYRAWAAGEDLRAVTLDQIARYQCLPVPA